MFMKRAIKVLIVGIIVFALATVTYAFAAANTVPGSVAGDGSGAITGYTISGITYTLDASTPTKISAVTFTLSAAAAHAVAEINAVASQTCVITGGTSATCTWTLASEPAVSTATTLEIIATQ